MYGLEGTRRTEKSLVNVLNIMFFPIINSKVNLNHLITNKILTFNHIKFFALQLFSINVSFTVPNQ